MSRPRQSQRDATDGLNVNTYELNDINPFDYLTELQKHANELTAHPADWMPWNYRDTLQKTDSS